MRGEPGRREVVLGEARWTATATGRASGCGTAGAVPSQAGRAGSSADGAEAWASVSVRAAAARARSAWTSAERDHDALRVQTRLVGRPCGGGRLGLVREGLGPDRLVVLRLAALEGLGVGGAVEAHVGGQHDGLLPGRHDVAGLGRSGHRRSLVLLLRLGVGRGAMQQGVGRAGEPNLLGQGEGLQPRRQHHAGEGAAHAGFVAVGLGLGRPGAGRRVGGIAVMGIALGRRAGGGLGPGHEALVDAVLGQSPGHRRIDVGHQLRQHGLVHQLPMGIVGMDLAPERGLCVAEVRFFKGGHGTRGCWTRTLSVAKDDGVTMVC